MARRIYILEGFPEEIIAVAFAKTSRSPDPFDQTAKELNDDKARQFHERWVVGYGHSSVAEHAVLHIAMEGVSRLAVERIESARLASYTEKSTRYQTITKDSFLFPEEFSGKYDKQYEEFIDFVYRAYSESLDAFIPYFKERMQKKEGEQDKAYEIRVRAASLDRARFLLTNSMLANVGMTVNARELERCLVKLLSSNVKEVRDIAEEIKREALKATPTLVKYANPSAYIQECEAHYFAIHREERSGNAEPVRLMHYTRDGVIRVIAAIMFRHSGLDYEQCYKKAMAMTAEERKSYLSKALSVGSFDTPVRELEQSSYTFELVMDEGAFCEFKRHRILSPVYQKPSALLGYYMPKEFAEVGKEGLFREAMERSEGLYKEIEKEMPEQAEYAITNAHNRRVLVTMNARELYHYIRLRASPAAHFTIREITQKMHEELKKMHPEIFEPLKPREK
ncbi:MAG: FAD-dependent thymidylate synthase [Candidatus Anstonellales archaeon]